MTVSIKNTDPTLTESQRRNRVIAQEPAYMTAGSVSGIYLTINSAAITYLTITSAAATYLTSVNAVNTYLSIASAGIIYLSIPSAAATYVTSANAITTYLSIASGNLLFLTIPSAAAAYLPLTSYVSNTADGYLTSSQFISLSGGALLTATAPISISANNITISAGSTTVGGYITSAAYNTFNGKENVLTVTSPLSRAGNTVSIVNVTASADGYLTSTQYINTSAGSGFTDASAALTYLKLNTSNGPVTGNLQVSKSAPELRLTDGDYSRINRVTASNELTIKNRVSVIESVITPLGHWYMDDNAANTTVTDSSGSGYNGTWTRNTSLDSVAGKINTALNGANANYAGCGNTFGNFEYTNPFSAFAWVDGDGDTGGEQQIIGKYQHNFGETGVYGWRISLYFTYRITVILKDAFGYSEQIKATYQPGGFPFSILFHIGFTYDGSGLGAGLKIYCNGVLVATGTGSLTHTIQTTRNVTLGAASDGGEKLWGKLDDVRLYNRELTLTNVQDIYAAGAGTQAEIGSITPYEVNLVNHKDSATTGEYGVQTFGQSAGLTYIDGNIVKFRSQGAEKAQISSNGLQISSGSLYVSELTQNGFVKTSGGTGLFITDTNSYLSVTSAAAQYLKLDGSNDPITGDIKISNSYLTIGKVYHAYGGFQQQSTTIACTKDVWSMVTNSAGNLWQGLEADSITLTNDVMTIVNAGDYFGTMTMTMSANNNEDYFMRVYNLTQSAQMGYITGVTGMGAGNYVTLALPLYFECSAGNQLRLEIVNRTNNNDPVVNDGTFYVNYLHD